MLIHTYTGTGHMKRCHQSIAGALEYPKCPPRPQSNCCKSCGRGCEIDYGSGRLGEPECVRIAFKFESIKFQLERSRSVKKGYIGGRDLYWVAETGGDGMLGRQTL